MRHNYTQFNTPQFRLLSDNQLADLHQATLQVLERAGVSFQCQEALDILGEAGADVSDPKRVKIPSRLVEQALKSTPRTVTLYSREGEPAIVLNRTNGAHFGACAGYPEIIDPYTRKRRLGYAEDAGDIARLCDALPNIERVYTGSPYRTLDPAVADEVALLQVVMNTTKPAGCWIMDGAASLKRMIDMCAMVAGGEKQLRRKPFFMGSSQPVSPLMQGTDAMAKSLLCAAKGIPNFIYPMPMAGATAPATVESTVIISNAEILSQLVAIQLKYPGSSLVIGSFPSIMDMKTGIFPTGAPELSVILIGLTELIHYYGLPVFSCAGMTDAEVLGAQAGAEITYQILTAALSGADFVHNIGLWYHSTAISPELIVLSDEIIGMVKVLMTGMKVNDDTVPLKLIEKLGPQSSFVYEKHTFEHFRNFWVPTVFDRSFSRKEDTKDCEDLLNGKTIKILETHKPKPLEEGLVKELKKLEKSWFAEAGLKYEYPKRKV